MSGATLLLVDDHAAFRAQARVLLEAAGFVVVGEAANGERSGRSGIPAATGHRAARRRTPRPRRLRRVRTAGRVGARPDRGADVEPQRVVLPAATAPVGGPRVHPQEPAHRPRPRRPRRVIAVSTKSLVASLVAAGTIAAVTEWIASDPADTPALRVADGVVGFVILAAAAVAWQRRRTSPIGLILGVAGGTWFAGALWGGLAYLHRGPLVHLHVSYPSGRLRWWPGGRHGRRRLRARRGRTARAQRRGHDRPVDRRRRRRPRPVRPDDRDGPASRSPGAVRGVDVRRRPRRRRVRPAGRLAGRHATAVGVLRRHRRRRHRAARRLRARPLGRRRRHRPRHRSRSATRRRGASNCDRAGAGRPATCPRLPARRRVRR